MGWLSRWLGRDQDARDKGRSDHAVESDRELQPEVASSESSSPEIKEVTLALDAVRPIGRERLCAIFDQHQILWETDSEGELRAGWEQAGFIFRFVGNQHEVLSVVGLHRGTIAAERENELLGALEEWMRMKLFPKAFIQPEENGLRVVTEHNVDLEHGATDDQLFQQCMCAVSTSIQLFTQINENFEVIPDSRDDEE
ncbi:YbjN domain-containing protein [Schaalia sp. ZJ405]|uniref:YbjN domain-containing protein n=1 Tax=Schaalia sp. ZJ405 TaxID=2709403 RepID=UPI0013EBDE95|nr:YbjN domain-containing protein [Schaalia sp. ZJ405]QPK81062.1 YbjN domain-containing protein [Schaalia sp. ZJ405]